MGALFTQETNNALSMWIYDCQQTCFHQEYKQLKSKFNKCLSLVRQLRLFLDAKGYICCGGRIHNSPLSELTKFLFLLPSKHIMLEQRHSRPCPGGCRELTP